MSAIRQDDVTGKIIATATIGGEEYQKAIITDDNGDTLGTPTNPAQVTGMVIVNNFPATQPVSGPLTNAELRAVPVSVQTDKSAITTGTVSAVGDTVVCTLGNAQGVTFGSNGTYAGLTCAFEGSIDGNKWYAVVAQRNDSSVARAAALAMAAVNYSLLANVQGFLFFRVRVTAITSGSATIWIVPLNVSAFYGEPTPSAVTVATTTLSGSTAYGHSTYHVRLSTAGINAVSVKASVGTIGVSVCSNLTNAWRYVKLFAKASIPTVGTDTPIQIYGIPPNTTITINAAAGQRIVTGIAYAITAAADPLDTTPIGEGEVIINLSYT